MLKLYCANNLLEATLLQDILSDSGIKVEIFNQHSAGAVGEIPTTEIWPELWIQNHSEKERALSLIQAFQDQQGDGSEHNVLCADCKEENPANFDLCWNCQSRLAG